MRFISQPVLRSALTGIWCAFHVSFDIQRPFWNLSIFKQFDCWHLYSMVMSLCRWDNKPRCCFFSPFFLLLIVSRFDQNLSKQFSADKLDFTCVRQLWMLQTIHKIFLKVPCSIHFQMSMIHPRLQWSSFAWWIIYKKK